ncbi:FAD-binding protein [Oceanobacillus kimchii]|uniref:FAD-binding oxidoreductase n=1 Tax=Oceanobacillus kimchii TaxID=746691 RepID=UPI0021A4C76E|nr:FAD-linked oxidase C-terminal domain-containing protein [Oceanobacillus kimchii]MCT1576474.1 FAD-binding protein [Oceanobacillus kimchii]MCT2136110.1 FAD-binding protein [Oceanobacillus kimchii]
METTITSLIEELSKHLEISQITQNEALLEQHSKDESYHVPHKPLAVVFPKNTIDVQHITRCCSQYEVPIYPFGVGSSLEGHVIPNAPGISVDFSLMNNILEINPEDLIVRVQPGVTRTQLEKELKKYGLFFPVDPGADATLGGMAATNASGTLTVKYGTMRDNVRTMEVVLANGTTIQTGTKAAKSSSGYHLNGLFVGSEGTLGCITELTLKVFGIPEHIAAGRATFPTVHQAIEAVVSVLQAGIPIARIEIVDEDSILQVNQYSELDLSIEPTLFVEFHGNKAGLAEDMAFTEQLFEDFDCTNITFESDTAARNQLWEARHNLAYAYVRGYKGRKMMITDVCLPISYLADAISHARLMLDTYGLPGGITGHVGDGNFHIVLMFDQHDEQEVQYAQELNEKVVAYALERGGTCTGEHGVGTGKKKYQQQEHGEALTVMRQLKQALDPNQIMNPNKIF